MSDLAVTFTIRQKKNKKGIWVQFLARKYRDLNHLSNLKKIILRKTLFFKKLIKSWKKMNLLNKILESWSPISKEKKKKKILDLKGYPRFPTKNNLMAIDMMAILISWSTMTTPKLCLPRKDWYLRKISTFKELKASSEKDRSAHWIVMCLELPHK